MIDYPNLEFCRHGYGMLADPRDKDPGAPICFPRSAGGSIMTGLCTCRKSKGGNPCSHLSDLFKLASEIEKNNKNRSLGENFAASLWYQLASLFSESDPTPCPGIKASQVQKASGCIYVFTKQNDALLARVLENSPASILFMERLGILTKSKLPSRAELIEKITAIQCTEEERHLNKAGALTRRQATEQSFWGRLAYHMFREYGDEFTFHPAIEHKSGDFVLTCCSKNKIPILELAVPRPRVRKLLALLASVFPGQSSLAIHPIPLKSIFCVTPKTQLDLEVRPAILALQASGEARFFQREDFAKFSYGDLVYIRELNLLAGLESPDTTRRFAAPVSMQLKKSQLPAFINEHREDIEDGRMVLDGSLRNLSVFSEFDRMEISLDALKRSWYWLSVRYSFGNDTISLADILQARQKGQRYLPVKTGWVDVNSEVFHFLNCMEEQKEKAVNGGKVRLSAIDLLRLLSLSAKPVQVNGKEERARILKQFLALTPAEPWDSTNELATPLRPYQAKGVDWLRFLCENRFGGLLCDDMGLGKTHQAMALMAWMKKKTKPPFLVVCPTSVISHWRNKIRDHAPGLTASVYHGGNRRIEDDLQGDVLLTSYGVMRNDIAALQKIPFALVIFDELQNLKNRETLGYQAACLLQTQMRIGLTGTPIENSIGELKSLFDLVLPGYLGSDEEFAANYLSSEGSVADSPHLSQLKRLISPFTLRRLKEDVLTELPEKIEDLRTCQLSELQVKLYREALETKGIPLLSQLESNQKHLPYIHIFALLNLLKRICDHPALVLNQIDEYQNLESGKWELFQELLFETLDSGRKAVVFTQYLGMIAIMERMLGALGMSYAVLTGSSQNRGEIVRRFNDELGCRVFLASLKAGGTGIDLLGGSTVIHYDRWWNAAREDQATDRVHRIGQKQAVQVFKLVAEGTLEEKIAAIIERKRQLMKSVVQADDPHLSKIFTREELIELLRPV
jgi:superfamily II DNA or RNA helicase